jgi:sensor histidine kinase YesM
MVHSIEILSEGIVKNLSIEEYKQENSVCISINDEFVVIDKEDLHSFIGTLLHVQSKLRGGKNG